MFMTRWLLFLSLAATAGPAASQSPPQLRPPPFERDGCTSAGFGAEISRAESWYRIFEIKRRSGFLPPEAMRRRIELQTRLQEERLVAALRGLSRRAPTYALIFGGAESEACVWLVGPDGILASGRSRSRATAPQTVWAGLDVQARSRASRSPRAADGSCAPPAEPAPVEPLADEFLQASREALRSAADALLPAQISTRLSRIGGGEARLLIVPTGNLRKIPFAALPLGDKTIVDLFATAIVPSLEAVLSPAPRRAGGDEGERLVIGNPDLSGDRSTCWADLPAAEREAKQVAALADGATLLTGEAASYAAVRQRLLQSGDRLQLVYLATHGVSDPDNPADGSFLALAGQHLRGADLRQITLGRGPLVVMSACQTGLGKDFAQGVFGLPEAWRYAGARTIVMSLWDVDDAGTASLMADFIGRLKERGWQGPEFALAHAMRAAKAANPDPMIWAAFSFHGDPAP